MGSSQTSPSSLSSERPEGRFVLTPWKRRTTLARCPIGLFECRGELCLKSEYGSNEGRIDAYIVSSGEFFWGDQPQTIASQRAQLVRPVTLSDGPKGQGNTSGKSTV